MTYEEELEKAKDEAEVSIMTRAVEEGLSARYAQAMFKIMEEKNPLKVIFHCLEAMGYDETRQGKPNLCPGTACLDDDAAYVQFWNEAKDSMFLLQSKLETSSSSRTYGLSKLVTILNENRVTFYYVGSDDYLKKIGMLHRPVDCPEKRGACDCTFKIYGIGDIRTAFSSMIKDDMGKYARIIREETEKVGLSLH